MYSEPGSALMGDPWTSSLTVVIPSLLSTAGLAAVEPLDSPGCCCWPAAAVDGGGAAADDDAGAAVPANEEPGFVVASSCFSCGKGKINRRV